MGLSAVGSVRDMDDRLMHVPSPVDSDGRHCVGAILVFMPASYYFALKDDSVCLIREDGRDSRLGWSISKLQYFKSFLHKMHRPCEWKKTT